MTGRQLSNPDDLQLAAKQQPRPALTADRITQIRSRLDAGVYASEAVLQATARAILERGDP